MAIYDSQDDLFAYLLVAAARRRGHTAKQIANIGEINDVFTSSPAAIIVGVSALDEGALLNVRDLHAAHHESLILVATEDSGARPLIAALERGATDVVHKPVLPGDLITRAEIAAANRGILNQSDDTIRISDLEIDINQALAVKAGHDLVLTRMELRLLYCLAQHRGRIAPTDRLLTFAGESDEFATSSLKTHISHLRQKLAEAGGQPVTIKARQMLGYVLTIDDPE